MQLFVLTPKSPTQAPLNESESTATPIGPFSASNISIGEYLADNAFGSLAWDRVVLTVTGDTVSEQLMSVAPQLAELQPKSWMVTLLNLLRPPGTDIKEMVHQLKLITAAYVLVA
ncbi:MAG TPA: hypothetical protein VM581_05235 [Magnetospirillaceae bacterium]|nr:hypothetical protein [Magnetospirillaceae bacterium]